MTSTWEAASGDVSCSRLVPHARRQDASGDVRTGNVLDVLKCRSASGDVRVTRAATKTNIASASGDVDLSVDRPATSSSRSSRVTCTSACTGSSLTSTATPCREISVQTSISSQGRRDERRGRALHQVDTVSGDIRVDRRRSHSFDSLNRQSLNVVGLKVLSTTLAPVGRPGAPRAGRRATQVGARAHTKVTDVVTTQRQRAALGRRVERSRHSWPSHAPPTRLRRPCSYVGRSRVCSPSRAPRSPRRRASDERTGRAKRSRTPTRSNVATVATHSRDHVVVDEGTYSDRPLAQSRSTARASCATMSQLVGV